MPSKQPTPFTLRDGLVSFLKPGEQGDGMIMPVGKLYRIEGVDESLHHLVHQAWTQHNYKAPELKKKSAMEGPWFHTTNATLKPGDLIEPSSARGIPGNYPDAAHYDPSQVYIWNPEVGVDPGQWGAHTYEVEPLGPISPDPEGLANEDPDDVYMYEGSYITPSARVIREIGDDDWNSYVFHHASDAGWSTIEAQPTFHADVPGEAPGLLPELPGADKPASGPTGACPQCGHDLSQGPCEHCSVQVEPHVANLAHGVLIDPEQGSDDGWHLHLGERDPQVHVDVGDDAVLAGVSLDLQWSEALPLGLDDHGQQPFVHVAQDTPFAEPVKPSFWHVAPRSQRESILQHGLDNSHAPFTVMDPGGVWLHDSEEKAHNYASSVEEDHGEPVDVYEVQPVHPPEPDQYRSEYWHPGPIPASNVRLNDVWEGNIPRTAASDQEYWVWLDGEVAFDRYPWRAAQQLALKHYPDKVAYIENTVARNATPLDIPIALGEVIQGRPQIYLSNVDRNHVWDAVMRALDQRGGNPSLDPAPSNDMGMGYRRSQNRTSTGTLLTRNSDVAHYSMDIYKMCDCGCGCECDGDWHFNEPRCVCRALGCPCVQDAPGQPIVVRRDLTRNATVAHSPREVHSVWVSHRRYARLRYARLRNRFGFFIFAADIEALAQKALQNLEKREDIKRILEKGKNGGRFKRELTPEEWEVYNFMTLLASPNRSGIPPETYKLWEWYLGQLKRGNVSTVGGFWDHSRDILVQATKWMQWSKEYNQPTPDWKRFDWAQMQQWVYDMNAKDLTSDSQWTNEHKIYQFPDGWYMAEVSAEDCALEGELMGHCVGGYGHQIANGTSYIVSLRDPKGHPHVTLEMVGPRPDKDMPRTDEGYTYNRAPVWHVQQIQGKQDREPIDEYKAYIRQWFDSLKDEGLDIEWGPKSVQHYDPNNPGQNYEYDEEGNGTKYDDSNQVNIDVQHLPHVLRARHEIFDNGLGSFQEDEYSPYAETVRDADDPHYGIGGAERDVQIVYPHNTITLNGQLSGGWRPDDDPNGYSHLLTLWQQFIQNILDGRIINPETIKDYCEGFYFIPQAHKYDEPFSDPENLIGHRWNSQETTAWADVAQQVVQNYKPQPKQMPMQPALFDESMLQSRPDPRRLDLVQFAVKYMQALYAGRQDKDSTQYNNKYDPWTLQNARSAERNEPFGGYRPGSEQWETVRQNSMAMMPRWQSQPGITMPGTFSKVAINWPWQKQPQTFDLGELGQVQMPTQERMQQLMAEERALQQRMQDPNPAAAAAAFLEWKLKHGMIGHEGDRVFEELCYMLNGQPYNLTWEQAQAIAQRAFADANLVPEYGPQPHLGSYDDIERYLPDSLRVGGMKKSDYQGWTNWDTWHVKLMMDNEQSLYNTSREMIRNGLQQHMTDEQLAQMLEQWSITHIIGPENEKAMKSAQEWNDIPQEERIDHHWEETNEQTNGLLEKFIGPDTEDTTPTLMDPAKVNWYEIVESLKDEELENWRYEQNLPWSSEEKPEWWPQAQPLTLPEGWG